MSGGAARSPRGPTERRRSAELSQWLVVEIDGNQHLFGYATRHTGTGGLSWLLSTPIVSMAKGQTSAQTASGTAYVLEERITEADLDEEGQVAHDLLIRHRSSSRDHLADLLWLSARKWARHLGLSCPARNDIDGLKHFFADQYEAYANIRRSGRD